MEKVPWMFQAFVYHEIGNSSHCARCSQSLALSLQYVLTELFFLYRLHCALFTSLERCLNSWRCFCQPPKTCWMRRTMVIPETLFSSATPSFTGWCTCYHLFGRNFWGVLVWFVSSRFYAVKANVIQKEGMSTTLLVSRTFTRHRWLKELFSCVLIHFRMGGMGKFMIFIQYSA